MPTIVQTFGYAFRGLGVLLTTQRNAWIHAGATLAVIGASAWFNITAPEWVWIVLAIASVWVAEALNTALEFLADATSPDFHPLVQHAKDVAAGGVLVAAFGAATVGLIVFGPPVIALAGA